MSWDSRQVNSLTVTSLSLLEGLRNPHDDGRWAQFYERYQPPLVWFIRRMGLRQHDAEDVAQDTLLAFAEGYKQGKYDRQKGRLRTWLLGIAKHKIADHCRKHASEALVRNETDAADLVRELPDDTDFDEIWEQEWQAAILRSCLEAVRTQVEPITMRAFELYVIEEQKPEAVAVQLGISRDSVYQARTRVIGRLRELQRTLHECW